MAGSSLGGPVSIQPTCGEVRVISAYLKRVCTRPAGHDGDRHIAQDQTSWARYGDEAPAGCACWPVCWCASKSKRAA